MRWQPGEIVVHREVWRGVVWCACPVVVEDTDELSAPVPVSPSPAAYKTRNEPVAPAGT